MKMRNSRGYTLLETLIVLFVVSSFLFLPSLALDKFQQTQENQQFYGSFEKHVISAQELAITSVQECTIKLTENQRKICFDFGMGKETRWQLTLPKNVVLDSSKGTIGFTISGSTKEIGNVVFMDKLSNKHVKYQFELGSGKYRKTEYY
ncbi:MAG: type II secretion system GspH family protein [Lactobacillales bacterium]|jgi:competence protein ComGD|nr:type II secretion system GspH family protein [Lactobacillales bacterium]